MSVPVPCGKLINFCSSKIESAAKIPELRLTKLHTVYGSNGRLYSFPMPICSVTDPGCLSRARVRIFPSRIKGQKYSGSRIQIRIKELKYFQPKILFPSSRKYDLGCSSRTPDPDLDYLQIPDPGAKKPPDPRSATLLIYICDN